MEDLIYTMVLSDGTIIENLRKNGDNYISASKLTADMFDGKLSEVTVKTSEDEMVMENMDLVQITEMNGEYWFVLRQFSATELAMAKMSSIVNCEQLLKELQRIAEIFEVDLNLYSPYVKAIDREIGLIKKWRQRDKKMESYFRCKGDV